MSTTHTDPSARRPRRASNVREYPLGDELLVYAPEGARAHALNVSARAIWMLCDGTRSTEDIVATLAGELECPPETIASDVTAALERLLALGLVEWS